MHTLYNNSEIIGMGTFGTIYRHGKYAIKIFKNNKDGEKERRAHEALSKIKAPCAFFIKAEWISTLNFKNSLHGAIKMPYMNSNAHLDSLNTQICGMLYVVKIMDPILKAITKAVKFLALHNYSHGDLKLSNVLTNWDESGISSVKVSDYSNVCRLGVTQKCYPLNQFCIYRHYSQFLEETFLNSRKKTTFNVCIDHDKWSLCICIVDLARQGHQCSCGCTDNRIFEAQHLKTAKNFRSKEFRMLHVVNVLDEFELRMKNAQSCQMQKGLKQVEQTVISNICDTYKRDALLLCNDELND